MAPVGTPAFSPVAGLPGSLSALLITTAAYADAQLAWLRPPVSGAHDLAAGLADPRAGGFAVGLLRAPGHRPALPVLPRHQGPGAALLRRHGHLAALPAAQRPSGRRRAWRAGPVRCGEPNAHPRLLLQTRVSRG